MPYSGLTPDAIAKAIPKGIATTPTVIPAIMSFCKLFLVISLKRPSLNTYFSPIIYFQAMLGYHYIPLLYLFYVINYFVHFLIFVFLYILCLLFVSYYVFRDLC